MNPKASITPTVDPDQELVYRVQDHDMIAFGLLYDKYVGKIYAFCYRNIGNREEAEDIAQDVFMELIKSIHSFEHKSQFRTWLYQVARFKIMDHWRKMYKSKTLSLEDFLHLDLGKDDVEVDVQEMQAKQETVSRILGLLPDNYRKILELRFLKNYSLKETAEEMGVTVGNVKVLQYRALKKAVAVSSDSYE